jgi:hypothetical protein
MAWECLGTSCPGCSTCDPLRPVAKNVTPRRLNLVPRPHTASMMEPVHGALDRDVVSIFRGDPDAQFRAALRVLSARSAVRLKEIAKIRADLEAIGKPQPKALARVRARRNSTDTPEGA